MSVWRAVAAGIVVLAVGASILLFAPVDNGRDRPTTDQPYPAGRQLRGDPVLAGIYELLALRGIGTESGRDVKGLLWHSMLPILLAVAAAAGTWHLLRPRKRPSAPAPAWAPATDADGLDPEERRALLRDWPAAVHEPPPKRIAMRVAVGGLILYALVNLAACMWSDAPDLSLRAAVARAIGVAWALGIAALLRRRWAGRAAIAVTIVSASAALLGLWFTAAGNDPWNGRLNFPMSNPDFLAAVLLAPTCLCAAGLAHVMWPKELGRGATWGRRPRLRMATGVGCGVGLALLGAAEWRAGSRAALFGLGVAAVTFLGWRLRRQWKLVPLVGMVAGAVLCGIWIVSSFGSSGDRRAESAETRIYLWRHALETIAKNPFIGAGPAAHVRRNQFAAGYDATRHFGLLYNPPEYHAHNELLEIAEEDGVAITAVFAAAVASAAVCGLRAGRVGRQSRPLLPAALAAGVLGMMGQQLFSEAVRYPGVAAAWWTWLGLLLAVSRPDLPQPQDSPAEDDRPFLRMAASTLVLMAGLLGAAVVIAQGTWPAQEAKIMSMRMRRPGGDVGLWTARRKPDEPPRRFERLLARDLDVAHVLETWQWRAEERIAFAAKPTTSPADRKDALDEAARILGRLDRRVPDFDRVCLLQGKLHRLRGEGIEADLAFQRQREKWPHDPRLLREAGPPPP